MEQGRRRVTLLAEFYQAQEEAQHGERIRAVFVEEQGKCSVCTAAGAAGAKALLFS